MDVTTPCLVDADQIQYPSTQLNRVLVIGLGQLGLPVAKYIKQRGGFDVYGYDISSKAMDRAQTTAGIKKATNFSDFDVYILCISTHKAEDMFSPQIEGLLSIIDKISKEAKNGALVSIESTIPKGTSKKVFEMLNHRLHVAHAPHRWYALEEKEHGVNQLRVVGGVCDCCLKVALYFYDGRSENMNNSSSSPELESLQGTVARAAAKESIGDLTSTEIATNGESDILNNQTISNSSSINNSNNNSSNNNISHGNNTKITSLGIPMHPVPEIETA